MALLFPIDWPEPFGLVMIEAMACGTPVIAFPCGSVPEVIDHGVTGFVVTSMQEAAAAVEQAAALDRAAVRATFERRFSARRMAEDYIEVYMRLGSGGNRTAPERAEVDPAVERLTTAEVGHEDGPQERLSAARRRSPCPSRRRWCSA